MPLVLEFLPSVYGFLLCFLITGGDTLAYSGSSFQLQKRKPVLNLFQLMLYLLNGHTAGFNLSLVLFC
jgi:hypothetical protein